MLCQRCHYSLKGLTEHRCPECGRAFDPADPSTFDRPRRKRGMRSVISIAIVTLVLTVFAALFAGIVASFFSGLHYGH